MFLNYYLTSGLTRWQNLGNTKASRLPSVQDHRGTEGMPVLTGTYTTGMGHRHLLPQPPHPQSHRRPSGCSSLAVHTPTTWSSGSSPPALDSLLLCLPPCRPSTHACPWADAGSEARHRDPTATGSLPGPHWPPHAHPSLARPVCLCLPLPAQMLSGCSLQTPRGGQGSLMSGKRISEQALPQQTSPLSPFLITSVWAILGVCVERESVLRGGEKKMEEES